MERKNDALVLGGTKGLGYYISKEIMQRKHGTIEGVVEVLGRTPHPEMNIPGETGYSTFHAVDLSEKGSVRHLCRHLEERSAFSTYDRFFWVAGQMLKGDFNSSPDDD